VKVEVLSTDDNGNTFAYEEIPGSPFDVGLGIVDWDFYFSEEDIQNNGFGVTEQSTFVATPNVVAGEDFIIEVIPLNNFDQVFTYFEDYAPYFLMSFYRNDECRFREIESKHCEFYSYDKTTCQNNPFCRWDHDNSADVDDYFFNRFSCLPCKGMEYSTPYNYTIVETDDNLKYFFASNLE